MGSATDLQIQQTACQALLTKNGACFGWLRGKTVLHKWGEAMDQKVNRPGLTQQITSMISWQRLYVVVSDGYLFIYKSETSKRPARVIDLCAFQRVEKEEYLKVKDVPWPFKVTSDLNSKVMYYGAMSEPELKRWIESVAKGIEDAKQSGRTPVIYEKKEALPTKPVNRKKKPLPRVPSIHSNSDDEDDDDDQPDDYDYIPDPIEDMQRDAKQSPAARSKLPPVPVAQSSSSGKDPEYEMSSPKEPHPKAMPKPSANVNGRKEMAVPPIPSEYIVDVKSNLKKTLSQFSADGDQKKVQPQVIAKVNPQPPVAIKRPPVPTATVRPAVPNKNQNQSKLATKPVPDVPDDTRSVNDEVEYETTDECIVKAATWTKSSEESTELMKTMSEDGIFMIRESTTGNGDQTLQVLSEGAVRKYKIVKDGKKFQMAGGSTFDSMAELLSFYQKNSIPNHATKLTKPYSRA